MKRSEKEEYNAIVRRDVRERDDGVEGTKKNSCDSVRSTFISSCINPYFIVPLITSCIQCIRCDMRQSSTVANMKMNVRSHTFAELLHPNPKVNYSLP